MGSSKESKARAVRALTTGLEVLEATGWCRGNFGEIEIDAVDGDGEHCAIGALRAGLHIEGLDWEPTYRTRWVNGQGWVRKDRVQRRKAVDVALGALAKEVPAEFLADPNEKWYEDEPNGPMNDESLVIDFNDSLGPDEKHEIVDLFKRAIARLS